VLSTAFLVVISEVLSAMTPAFSVSTVVVFSVVISYDNRLGSKCCIKLGGEATSSLLALTRSKTSRGASWTLVWTSGSRSSFCTIVVAFVAAFAVHLNYAQLRSRDALISKEEFAEKTQGVIKKLTSIWNKGFI